MVAQSGQDLLLKLDLTGSGDFQTIGGLRTSKLSFNAQTVNVTHMGSPGQWRELLEGAGVRHATVSGSGIFVDGDTDARMRELFFDGQIPQIQMVIPDFGTITGAFQITSMEYAGNYDGEVTYDLAFASAGVLHFDAHIVAALP